MPLYRSLWVLGVATFIGGCGSSYGGGGGSGPPSELVSKASLSGDAQTGTVGQTLAESVTVLVTRDGTPESGVTVNWGMTSGGSLSPVSSLTGADGTASTAWSLGHTAGAQTATASVSGAGGSPVTFTATAQAGAATALARVSGNGQSARPSSALPLPIVVRVTDQFGNPVSGATVQWTVTVGGGSVTPTSGVTNQAGQASTTWTMGAADGADSLEASATGLTGSPLVFQATAVTPPPPPTSITIQVNNDFFSPQVDTVAAGGTVTWNWNGGPHNVTSVLSPSFTSSTTQTAPATFGAITFSTAGTYQYICTIHGSLVGGQTPSGMHGTVVVE